MANACDCGWHIDPKRHERLHDVTCPERMRWTLDAIADLLDGKQWDSETAYDIVGVLMANGYEIRDIET